jgi:hypothetical protein
LHGVGNGALPHVLVIVSIDVSGPGADRLRRDRKRASLHRATTLEATWWRVEHAEYMLALRINRRNGDWKADWAKFGRSSSPAANQNRPPLSRKVAA